MLMFRVCCGERELQEYETSMSEGILTRRRMAECCPEL